MIDKEKISEENNDNKNNEAPHPQKPTYLNEIITVLKHLGGKADLPTIFGMIEKRNILPYIKTNPAWKDNVRAEIQRHSSDAD